MQHSFQNVITHDVIDVLGPVIARSVHLSQWLSAESDVTRRALRRGAVAQRHAEATYGAC